MLSSFLLPLPPSNPLNVPLSCQRIPSLFSPPVLCVQREVWGTWQRLSLPHETGLQTTTQQSKYYGPPALQYHNFINIPQTRNSKSGGSPCRILKQKDDHPMRKYYLKSSSPAPSYLSRRTRPLRAISTNLFSSSYWLYRWREPIFSSPFTMVI